MAAPSFVHLRVHSEFSLIDSVVKVKKLLSACVEKHFPAIALTDQSNFFGLVKFYKAAIGAGVKPIIGSDFILDDGENLSHFTLLAMDNQGYKNITELISLAYLKGQKLSGDATITWADIEQYHQGVIVLSGGKRGDVGQALVKGNDINARANLERWLNLFAGRYYLELQRTERPDDESYLHQAVALAGEFNCPVVATNEVCFLEEREFDAHESRVCIHDADVLDDHTRPKRYSPEQYLKSAEQMQELFADIPSALSNTVEIAKMCNVQLHLGEYFLPEYPIPDDFENDPFFNEVPLELLKEQTEKALTSKWQGKEATAEYQEALRTGIFFRKISREGLDERLAFLFDVNAPDFPEIKKEYIERLDFELDVILSMGFPGYFLIVMEFIQWAKDNAIPVGPGRGSGAGSLVAYAQKITDLDPIKYDLLFERFLNPERVSMPDFDVDFCMDKRERVIEHVADLYGRMAVSQIVTFGTMAAKAVVRDVARVQGKPYGLADRLSKMIPFEVGINLTKAYEQEEALRDFLAGDEDAQEIWDMALQLEGTVRGVGKHAGGVVIAPTKLTDFAPIYCDENGEGMVTQFDKDDVEEAGLVKFDFLGLRTLTIIDWALAMIAPKREKQGLEPLDIAAIPLDDAPTFALLKRAETTAVFQLESRGMKELIKKLQPDNLEDMIALVALFRPGPLDSGMVDDFVNRKHGRAEVAYPDAKYQHEWLKPILEPTYGVIVYQEQVMQIAQVLAGYSLGGADLLRRAMGKKKPEEMAKQREAFREGSAKQGVDPDLAMKIFDLVEKFAGYGFNKSHSAAYALVSYQTAWLKTHYPAQFMAGVMSSELQNTDKIVVFIEECRQMGLTLLNPDVNQGDYSFTVNDDDAIIYGLGAIKGLGEGPIEALMAARKAGGPFTDLYDFCERIDTRKVNKRALEALIKSGAFDSLGEPRSVLFASISQAMQAAEQQAQNANAGIDDLFGAIDDSANDVYADARNTALWSPRETLKGERDTLGLFLTGHPIDEYEQDLKRLGCKRLQHLKEANDTQLLAGLIVDMRMVKTKRGDSMAIITLDDRTARVDVTVFAKLLPEVQEKLQKDAVVFIHGSVRFDEYSGGLRISAESVKDIAEIRASSARAVKITLDAQSWQKHEKAFGELVLNDAQQEKGLPIVFEYHQEHAKAIIKFAQNYRLLPDDDSLEQLQRLFGAKQVTIR